MNRTRLSHFIFMSIVIIAFCFGTTCCLKEKLLQSPDRQLLVTCSINEKQEAVYSITKGSETVIQASKLGVVMNDNDFSKNLKLKSASKIELVSINYEMIQGKKKIRNYKGNKQIFTFENENGAEMQIIFKVSNDGVAFQYCFPGKSDDIKKIIKELTSFTFSIDTRAWMQPMAIAKSGWCRTNPSYEEDYLQNIPVGTVSPLGKGWVFPALLKSGENWVLLSETGLDRNYCGSRLFALPNSTYQIGFPEELEKMPNGNVYPESTLPWTTPWRVITIGSLKTIVESTLETDIANPKVEGDFSWVKPGKSSWSWVLLKDDSTIYEVQKKYIDYAADMNWNYCLIDADWDQKIGYEKMAELAAYAKSKGIGVNVWFNSAGSWNDAPYTPRDALLTAEKREEVFSKLQQIGVTGVKVDFFGGDGQSVINYYIDLIEAAAQHGLMINFHGCTYPRSWHRTYPNLVTMESIKGMEFTTFEQANADRVVSHGTLLNYIRNASSPMDFTPMCLYKLFPTERKTSNTYELATAVLFLSGIQHYAERPEGIASVPPEVKTILQALPTVYDETVFVDGYPGKLTVIARRSGDTWYVAGINGENIDKTIELNLSFINPKSGILINEGNNSYSMNVTEITLDEKQIYSLIIKANGGFLFKFE